MTIKCDVLVVGAGPAGVSAARTAASKGAKVICVDKKEEVGIPVKCAEGIGLYLFPYLPFKIPEKFLEWEIKGICFYAEDANTKKEQGLWEGYSLNRREFENWLATEAKKNGVKIYTSTELIDLTFDSDCFVKKATLSKNDKKIEIIPKKIVAADGAESKTMTLLGMYKVKRGDLAEVYSWEMTNLKLKDAHFEQIYFGEFAPAGYAYIFPKSKNTANVGVGSVFPRKKMDDYFNSFIQEKKVAAQLRKAKFVRDKSKKTTFDYILERSVIGNVIAVGDVANHNLKPFIEGILPSVICGHVAGAYVANNLEERLDDMLYNALIKEALPGFFEISDKALTFLRSSYKKNIVLQTGLLYNFMTTQGCPVA